MVGTIGGGAEKYLGPGGLEEALQGAWVLWVRGATGMERCSGFLVMLWNGGEVRWWRMEGG